VIDALARKGKVRVVVDGLTAANDLGLTNAVPARIGVLTDRRLPPITLGNLTLDFQAAAPSAGERRACVWLRRSASRLTPLLLCCARTVSEPHLFDPRELRFERKQIPRFVGIVSS